MTSRNAIAKACALRPNMIDEEVLAGLLFDLELDMAEMMRVDVPECLWPEEQELLMPAPKDNCYVLYLCAQIDFINQETALYQNDATMAAQSVQDAKSWWWRNNGPYIKEEPAEEEDEENEESSESTE